MTASDPVIVVRPPAGAPASPLVCDSPHSGTRYPTDFGHAVDLPALRRSEDTHVDALWESVPRSGGTLICATFPRSYIDANREETDLDVAMIEGTWPHPVRPTPRTLALGSGLVWRDTPEHLSIYQRRLSTTQLAHRIEGYWRPYRNALLRELTRIHDGWGAWWHLNLHSMPSNAYERLGLPPGKPLADVVLGDRHGTTCDAAFRDVVARAFSERGYSVAINDPYEGAELVRISGDPSHQRHSLQIEINRALYMDEATRERNAGFDSLRSDIARVIEGVRTHVQAKSAALLPPHGEVTTRP